MGNATPNSGGDVYDVRRIRKLVELMNEHDLNEIDLRQADTRIRIRRGGEPTVVEARPAMYPPPAAATSMAASAATPPADTGAGAAGKNIDYIRSPTVGTYYAASEPGAPAFVKVGDRVSRDTTVCVVEAMKVFNAIPAEISGRIVEILVENEQPVEYNQPLFKVDTT